MFLNFLQKKLKKIISRDFLFLQKIFILLIKINSPTKKIENQSRLNTQSKIKMKIKSIFSVVAIALFFFTANASHAQKVAIVDINQVLATLPDYKRAQDDLDKIAQRWRSEIAQQQDAIKGMYNKYQAEQVLLADDARKQREEEILNREKEVREAQRVKFGPEGELFKKRQELVKPIQDKVYNAIEKFANERGYDLILDKSASAGIIFSNPTYDKTQQVVEMVKKM